MINNDKMPQTAYLDKLILNKNSTMDMICSALNNYYSDYLYGATELQFKMHPVYIANDIVQVYNKEYLKYAGIQNTQAITNFKNFFENEIYNTIYVEHESSSRKAIKNILNNVINPNDCHECLLEKNLIDAYAYLIKAPKFNKENIRTVYGILTTDIDMKRNELDGRYYRLDDVVIGNFQGIESQLIESHMNMLIDFFNDDNDEDFIIKAIMMHAYFEMIHPYYDFNGRMGRLIIFWYTFKIKRHSELLFFSTAMAHYRDQYLKIFKETQKLHMLDMTYPVVEMLKILTANKVNYAVLQRIKEYSLDKYCCDLSYLSKDMIMRVLAIRDIYEHKTDNWIDKSTIAVYYKEYSDSVIYNELHALKNFKIVELSKTKPLKIKFLINRFMK